MATFKGVSSNADNRFTDKEKKLMKTMKFPKEYELKVDFQKVNWEVMKSWIATRVTELLGVEDEVLVGYIYEQLDGQKTIDPRILQINLTGFLEKNTSLFTKELWSLLASANETQSGIPQKILDDKAEELRKKKEMQDKINERLAKDREKREAERRESIRKEEEERKKRRDEREKEREAERAKRDATRKADREKEEQRQKERGREREKREAARRAERELEREKERERDRERRRRLDEEERPKRRQRSNSLPPDATETVKKHARDEETAAEGKGVAEPDKKKAKKEKKAKKVKKEKKDKKAKKEKKEKREKRSGSVSSGRAESPDLDRKKSLEDDLRQKALQSVKSKDSS